MHRSGHIALAGPPNAGKSSLLNRLVGTHLAIVSPKAQTTRLPVVGLLTTEDTQYVFHDLPGLLEPRYALQARMRDAARAAMEKVHVILHLHPLPAAPAPAFWPLTGLERALEVPVLTVYTKSDLVLEPSAGLGLAKLVSAVTGAGVEDLLREVRAHLPVGAPQFGPDEIGTQPLRFFAAEYVREAGFELLEEELPYALAVEVEEFREHARPMYIRVTLLVERESQKGIVIGQGGRTLKAIGQHARGRLEALLGEPVYLDCWVKVLRDWRRSPVALDQLGFGDGER
jgi:GTP-binding protein Era